MKRSLWIAFICALGAPVSAEGLLAYQDDAVIAEGKQIYADYCAACH